LSKSKYTDIRRLTAGGGSMDFKATGPLDV
jgi:hypothetical protein